MYATIRTLRIERMKEALGKCFDMFKDVRGLWTVKAGRSIIIPAY